MDILIATALVAGGLVLLGGGGEALVRGATTIARIAGLTPAVIGLTVVAMGTSLPELVVSVIAAIRDQPDIAVGNVIGSNIFNVTAVLGVTSLLVALPVRGGVVRLEWPFMFAATCLTLVFMHDLIVDRWEGTFFVIALVLFTAFMVRLARREVSASEEREIAEAVEQRTVHRASRELAVSIALALGGMLLLVAGGRLLVDGASSLARIAGLSERVIGLTVVAAGTSMPEMAASLVAAYRRQTDVAVGNVVGSNIFNLLGILGITAVIHPVAIAPAILDSDVWWMLGTSLLLLPLMVAGLRISRLNGALLLALYVVYTVLLFR